MALVRLLCKTVILINNKKKVCANFTTDFLVLYKRYVIGHNIIGDI